MARRTREAGGRVISSRIRLRSHRSRFFPSRLSRLGQHERSNFDIVLLVENHQLAAVSVFLLSLFGVGVAAQPSGCASAKFSSNVLHAT